MRKIFTEPELEIIHFDTEDILSTSEGGSILIDENPNTDTDDLGFDTDTNTLTD